MLRIFLPYIFCCISAHKNIQTQAILCVHVSMSNEYPPYCPILFYTFLNYPISCGKTTFNSSNHALSLSSTILNIIYAFLSKLLCMPLLFRESMEFFITLASFIPSIFAQFQAIRFRAQISLLSIYRQQIHLKSAIYAFSPCPWC